MELTFFGLTSNYRKVVFTQIHDLVYHGGGGFLHSEVYNMPIWMRKFHIQKINEHNEEQNKKIEKAKRGQNPDSNKVQGPNIPPSSTYNY